MSSRALMLIVAALSLTAQGAKVSEHVAVNPIRRVVTMLANIQKKVDEEAKADEDLHQKYMCYCKTGKGSLEKSIADAETKVEEVSAAIKEAEGQKAQLEQDLKDHKADRTAAKKAVAEATSLREKEAAAYAAVKAESSANVAAIEKAVAALEKGMAGAFLQTSAAQQLRQLVQSNVDMQDADRQDMVAFLASAHGSGYAPASGQITGILKQLGDEMGAGLSDATAAEEAAIKNFEELTAAKKKEIAALTSAIEEKSTRVGEIGVSVAEMKNEHGDTIDSLADDKKFLADLNANCDSKAAEYDEIVKTRAEELVALAETIKLLNDDDALELFKKTLPSAAASLLQVTEGAATVKSRALAMIHMAEKRHQPMLRLDFIALALHGKQAGFEKVIGMVDEMVASLKDEQAADDNKLEFCAAEFDKADDKKKGLELDVSDAEKAIADAEGSVTSLAEEITALGAAIKALDEQVAEATAQRKEENSVYTELMASNTAAKELIHVAKNRLNKFYNPKLYKAPPKRELSEEERISVNMGGTMAPTPAPGGIAGTGITAFVQVATHSVLQDDEAPPPPPEAVGEYKKKSEASGGVIAMMDLLVKDLDKEMTVAETEEKDAQADYEKAMKDAAKKRADDAKTLGDKESAKADAEAALQSSKDDKASASKQLAGTLEEIANLHADCDWLIQYGEMRKQARSDEISALGNAKAVLSGADYSLIQTQARSLRGHL